MEAQALITQPHWITEPGQPRPPLCCVPWGPGRGQMPAASSAPGPKDCGIAQLCS
jgi:hypothetical protein